MVDFSSISHSIAVLAWPNASPSSTGFGGSLRMRLLGVTLDDFLGSSFLTSCLVITSVTFSFPLGSLGPNFYLSFSVPFLTGDFMKNDVIGGFFASLSVGKEGNGNSSLSLCDPSPKLATFLSFLHGSTP